MRYIWACDGCRQSGELPLPVHVGVWEAFVEITTAHRSRSPECRDVAIAIRVPGAGRPTELEG